MTPINPYEPPRPGQVPSPVGALPVRATGVLAPEDALSALAAVGKWRPWRMPLIVTAVLLVVAALWLMKGQGAGWVGSAIAMGSALLMLTAPFRAKSRFAKTWYARPEHVHPIVWTFSDDGLLVESINSKHLHTWQAYLYALVTADKLILAQHGDQMFNFVPRRCFNSDSEWQTVCQLLASKLPVRQAGGR